MMKIADTSTPVVILKLEHYGSLGIMRSLGRLGVPVFGIDSDAAAPAFSSRYCRGKFVVDCEGVDPEQAIDTLLCIGRMIGRPAILIPTSDEMAMLVAEGADLLQQTFMFQHNDPALVRSLASKKEMYALARTHGIPTAETFFPESLQEVVEYAMSAAYPVMLKGIDGGKLVKRTGKKMLICRSKGELLDAYETMEDPSGPNIMLQEYIPGGDDAIWMFNGYFDEQSECIAGYTGKKIRQNPVYTGMTSLGICLKNDCVASLTKSFMKAIGYRGILDIGYRFDSRDGTLKVLDVNPRIGATFRLFVGRDGMDVARALYLGLTGQPVPHDEAPEGRKWIVEDKDIVSCVRYSLDGALRFGEWLGSYRGVREAGYFSFDDFLPFASMCAGHIRRRFFGMTPRYTSDPFIPSSTPTYA